MKSLLNSLSLSIFKPVLYSLTYPK
jgi:hypothetical protein